MPYLMILAGNLAALTLVTSFIPGGQSSGLLTLLISTLILTLLTLILRPLLLVILLPLNMLTLGLFSVLINSWLVMLTDKMIPGLAINGFVNALITALIAMVFIYLLRRWYRTVRVKQ